MSTPSTMTVPRFEGERRITFQNKPVPQPGAGQLLIHIQACAICDDDLKLFNNGSEITPGQQAAGIVAAAGPVTVTRVGTHGILYPVDYCGECRSCMVGATNLCLSKHEVMGSSTDGSFCPYVLIKESSFLPIEENLPFDEASILNGIISAGGHALNQARMVRDDIESVLIAGAGPLALAAISMVKILLGDSLPVVAIDPSLQRLHMAVTFGAMAFSSIPGMRLALGDGLEDGADIAFDTTGNGELQKACLKVLGKRGALICMNGVDDLVINTDRDLISPEHMVIGSNGFRLNELKSNIEIYQDKRETIVRTITHRFPAEMLTEAFEAYRSGETGAVVISNMDRN